MEQNFGYNLQKSHTDFIVKLVELTGCQLYLELGIFMGNTIIEVQKICKNCIGVDIYDGISEKNFEFHLMSTNDFFKSFNKNPNIIFIDADHNFNQVKQDFINSLNCLSKYGIILIHDTDPFEKLYVDSSFCGDSYKIHTWIKENYNDLNIVTLPIGVAGITMINRNTDRRILNFIE